MKTIFLGGRNQLASDDWSVSSIAGGTVPAGTYFFALQAKNIVGKNLFSKKSITLTSPGTIVITVNSTALRENEDWHTFIISYSATDTDQNYFQVKELRVKELYDTSITHALPLSWNITSPSALSVTTFADPATLLASPSTFVTGQVVFVSSLNNFYQYTKDLYSQPESGYILASANPNYKWRILPSQFSFVTNLESSGGYLQDVREYASDLDFEFPAYLGDGSYSYTLRYILMPENSSISQFIVDFGVFIGSLDYSTFFYNKLQYRISEVINVDTYVTRPLENSPNNIPFLSFVVWNPLKSDLESIVDSLDSREGFLIELQISFFLDEFTYSLPENSALRIYPYLKTNLSMFNQDFANQFGTGFILYSQGSRYRRVFPNVGLSVNVGSGAGLVKGYTFPLVAASSVTSLPDDTAEISLVVNSTGAVYAKDTPLTSTEALRALVSTEFLESSIERLWTVKGLTLTFTHPTLNPTIRDNYPDVIAGEIGHFNPTGMVLYLENTSTLEVKKFTVATIVTDITLDWNDGTVVAEIPPTTTVKGFYDPLNVTSNVSATTYILGVAYTYTSTVSAITHSPVLGCILELPFQFNNSNDVVSILGTAAFEDIGTQIGQIPVLQNLGGTPALPAVDGSLLTGLEKLEYAFKNTNFNADVLFFYFVSASGNLTINLPTSPTPAKLISFYDYSDSFGTHTITLNGQGENIEGTPTKVITVTSSVIFLSGEWKIIEGSVSTNTVPITVSNSIKPSHLETLTPGTDGQLPSYNLATDTFTWINQTSLAIGDNSVTTAKLQDGAVTTNKILDGSVTNEKLADNSIKEVKLNATNSPTDNQILTYDSLSGGFTWIDPVLTTKGDVYTHNATEEARLPVGTNGQVLTANSSTDTGLAWTTPATISVTDETTLLTSALTALKFVGNGFTATQSAGEVTVTSLTFGTAATLNVGTGANNVVQLDGTGKLPALDGSQLTSVSAAALSVLSAKGDLWTYSSSNVRLPVGTNGQFLTANSATSTGLEWVQIDYSDLTGTPTIPSAITIRDEGTVLTATPTSINFVGNGFTATQSANAVTVTSLNFGTASTLNVGTSANSVVQLDGTGKLPAIDGSQLTNLPEKTFLSLTDTPNSFTANKVVVVNATGTALEFIDYSFKNLIDVEDYTNKNNYVVTVNGTSTGLALRQYLPISLIENDTIPPIKLETTNTGSQGQFLTWDINQFKWVDPPTGTAITVKDETTTLTTGLTELVFAGAGVTATNTGSVVTVTITATGAIADGSLTLAKLNDVAANTILGNPTGAAGAVAEIPIGVSQLFGRGSTGNLSPITLGTNISLSGTTLNVSSGTASISDGVYGDIQVSNSGATWSIIDDKITESKLKCFNAPTTGKYLMYKDAINQFEWVTPTFTVAPNSITDIELANSAVTTNELANSAVTTLKLADNAVTTTKITDLSVTNEKIANSAVISNKLADGSVTTTKVADLAITTAKMADLGVTTDKLYTQAVTTTKIANSAVTTDKLADDSVTVPKVATTNSPTNGQYLTYNSASTSFTWVSLPAANLANGSVTTNIINDLAVTTNKIQNLAVTGEKIADNSIKEVKLNATNTPTDGQILSFDSATGGFTWIPSGGGVGVTDGDKGDITVSSSGATWTIDTGVVTLSKLVPATGGNRLLGRSSGSGVFEEITLGSNISLSGTTLNVSSGTATVGDGTYGDVVVSGGGTVWTVTGGLNVQNLNLTQITNIPGGVLSNTNTVTSAFDIINNYLTDYLTTFNVANELVKLDGTGKLPAVDGSALINLDKVEYKNTNFTASGRTLYLVDTSSSAITVNLPGSPTVGTKISFADYAGTDYRNPTGFGKNSLTVNPNGNTIEGDTSLEIDIELGNVSVVFVNGEWKLYSDFNPTQTTLTMGNFSYNDLTNLPTFAAVATTGSYSDLINTPSLGTAAALNVGTSANNVVQLDGTGKLPAVDGSQLTNISAGTTSPLTTKGDIWTYSTVNARLAVGSNTQVLKANSGTTTGLEWAAVAYSELTGTPTLGTVAALNVGTSANNVVQLDGSARLPAVDGSQLTNLPVPYQQFKATQTTSFSVQASDHGLWIPCSTNNLTVTLPNGLPTGLQVIIDRRGTQTVTITATTTLLGKNVTSNSVAIANQWGVVHVTHTGSDIWRITGDL